MDRAESASPSLCEDPLRLAALRRYAILDTPREEPFDDLARLAADICQAPVAAIIFVDGDRQWCKSEIGVGVRETPLRMSICADVLNERDVFVADDLVSLERFKSHAAVVEAGFRFYAGAILCTPDGHALGTLCVADRRARTLNDAQANALRALARQVMTQLELRRALEEQRRAKQSHRENADRLSLALAASNLGDWIWEARTDLMTLSRRAAEIFGVASGRGRHTRTVLRDLIEPPWRDAARLESERAAAERLEYDIEYRIRRADGKRLWVAAKGRGIYDADGAITHMLGVVQDITTRKENENALRASEARARLLGEISEAAGAEENPEAVMAAVVQIVGRRLGVSRCAYADVEADGDAFTVHADFCADGVQSIAGKHRLSLYNSVIAENQRAGRTTVVRDAAAEFDGANAATMEALDVRASICCPLIRNGRLRAMMAVHQNTPRQWTEDEGRLIEALAERSWAHIERARAARDLARSEGRYRQLADEKEILLVRERAARGEVERVGRIKDEFLATLSHELRTPLNAILGWAQVLRAAPCSPDDLREALEIIERNARAQTQIIEDLLDMSRIINGKLRLDVRRINLASVVEAAIETVRPAADAKGVRLQTVLDPKAEPVSGDRGRLQQVFWNLLSNAIKFTARGGRVQVLLERVESHLEIKVVDTGEGIDDEFLPFVFDRFRQQDSTSARKHGGLGLGLAIVKQLVELHGGTVRVASGGPGRGTTFTVALPLMAIQFEAEPEPRRHALEPAASPDETTNFDLNGVHALVVDDEADARTLVRRLLEDRGATVTTAGSAREAFERVRERKPDVLVSDIGMPGEDGLSLLRRIRSLPPEQGGGTPAVALTAYARAEDRTNAVLAGFQTHLAKPAETKELLAVVASLAGRLRSGLDAQALPPP